MYTGKIHQRNEYKKASSRRHFYILYQFFCHIWWIFKVPNISWNVVENGEKILLLQPISPWPFGYLPWFQVPDPTLIRYLVRYTRGSLIWKKFDFVGVEMLGNHTIWWSYGVLSHIFYCIISYFQNTVGVFLFYQYSILHF